MRGGFKLSVSKRLLGLAAQTGAGEYFKEATSGSRWNKKLIACWEGLIMKREHVDLLELSTLKSALRSVVEEIGMTCSDEEVP